MSDQPGKLDELVAAGLDHEVGGLRRLADGGRRLLGHRDQPPSLAKHAYGACQRLAAHCVEDEIDRGDGLFERDGRAVDGLVRSEREHVLDRCPA